MKKLYILALLPLFLAACGKEGAYVSKVYIGGSVNEQQEIADESVSFTPDQPAFHVHTVVEGISGPTEVVGSWWYLPAQHKIYETRVAVAPGAPVAKFALTNTQDWPVGRYRFVLTSEERELTQKEFEVTEAE